MMKDRYGYGLTTGNAEAAASYERAVEDYVAWGTGTVEHLNAAMKADPEFALPYIAKGLLLVGLRKPELHGAVAKLLAGAEQARAPETERERHYLAALKSAAAGRITEAVSLFEQIALEHPNDLFALRLSQFELFWIGEVAWMRDISERAAPAWQEGTPGYGAYLAIRAFGLEENGAFAEAERCGRRAIELDPTDSWAAHAVAHVLIMQGRLADGIAWSGGLSGNWERANHIRHHNWWHLALFHTEAGHYDEALAIYDGKLRDLSSPLLQAIPDFYVDIQNDVALLQRLELRGLDVGDRWGPIADLGAQRIANTTSPFTSAHCVLALAADGRFEAAEETLANMRAFAGEDLGSLGPRYVLAAIPSGEAAVAHRKGDHARVAEILLPARRNLWQMGGSHAQRDLFFQLLVDSLRKLGRKDLLAVILQELGGVNFERLEERSSYADAAAMAAAA